MFRSTRWALVATLTAVSLASGSAFAQAPSPQAATAPQGGRGAQAQPEIPPEPLSALAPANLAKPRPAAPFNLTGNWLIDTSTGADAWRFGPPYPKLTPSAQVHADASQKYLKEGKVYRDDIGQCWPAGMRLIMTRYWPFAFVQTPAAIYFVSGFMNSFRTIFLDGRPPSDPDVVVRTFNGESIGRWEGNTLVVDTQYFRGDHHWMDQGGMSIPAGEKLRIIERMRMVNRSEERRVGKEC